jgi:hypothetical protein
LERNRQAMQFAIDQFDVDSAIEASTKIEAAQRVLAELEKKATPPIVEPGATDRAAAELGAAVSAIPADPQLAAELETAAFASWQLQRHPLARQPIVLPAEEAVLASLNAYRRERDDVRRAVQSWSSPAIQEQDSVLALERALSLIGQVADVAARGRAIAEEVEQSNAARWLWGIEWDDMPSNIVNSDAYARSPEQKALVRFRERRKVPV